MLGEVTFGTDVIELVTVSPDRLYTFDRDSNTLITISTSDASVLSTTLLNVDISPQPRGFDLSPTDGKLYGVLPSLQLRTIDPATGITTLVAALTGVNNIEAIAFAPDGTLYASVSPSGNQGTHLYTIDPVNGALSPIGSMDREIDTLGYASDGFLYGATSGPGRSTLFRIDPATASTTAVGDTGVNSIVGITEPAVEPPVLDVSIDIKPGGDPVCNGVIPVAILGSDTLDVIQIDQTTLSFEGLPVRERGNGALSCNITDANSDGYTDLVCQYQDTTTEGTLTGELLDGTPIEGADTFCVVH